MRAVRHFMPSSPLNAERPGAAPSSFHDSSESLVHPRSQILTRFHRCQLQATLHPPHRAFLAERSLIPFNELTSDVDVLRFVRLPSLHCTNHKNDLSHRSLLRCCEPRPDLISFLRGFGVTGGRRSVRLTLQGFWTPKDFGQKRTNRLLSLFFFSQIFQRLDMPWSG